MKKLFLLTAAFIIILLSGNINAKTPTAAQVGYFYSALTPYGSWIEIDAGVVAWRPTMVRRYWEPYSEGRWIYTNCGWYWDSYEPFGQITFHYGRWHYDDYYGWIWLPDYEWAPAWVEWRYDDDYIGWAPMSPYGMFSINIGIHYTYDYHVPYHHWHFVNYRYFDDPYVYNHYVPSKNKYRIYNRTQDRTYYSYRDGRIYNNGIDIREFRNRGGRDIRERNIEMVRDPQIRNERGGNNDRIRSYMISKDEIRNERENFKDIKRNDNRKSSLRIDKIQLGDRQDRSSLRDNNGDRQKLQVREKDNTVRDRNNDKQRIEVRDNDNTIKDRNNDRRKLEVRNREQEQKNNSYDLKKREDYRNQDVRKNQDIELKKRNSNFDREQNNVKEQRRIEDKRKFEMTDRQQNRNENKTQVREERNRQEFQMKNEQRNQNRQEVKRQENKQPEIRQNKREDKREQNNTRQDITRKRGR
ncbi:MAG TPA: DUF6600 domain-containing protein [Ignavibacteriaceae bacterium]|nr:DUF6600 domain-containing protein [Ignavibacteriaceae bacterium]